MGSPYAPQMPQYQAGPQMPQASLMSQTVEDGDNFSFPADRDFWNNFVTQVRLYPGAMDPPHFHIDATHTDESVIVNQEFLRRFVAGWERANPHAVKLSSPQGATQFHASEEFWSRFVNINDQRAGERAAAGQPVNQDYVVQSNQYNQPVRTNQQDWQDICQSWEQEQQARAQQQVYASPSQQPYACQSPPQQQQPMQYQPPPQQPVPYQPPPQQPVQYQSPPPQQPVPYQSPPPQQPVYQSREPAQYAQSPPPQPYQPQPSYAAAAAPPGGDLLSRQNEQIDRNRGALQAKEQELLQQQAAIEELQRKVEETTRLARSSVERDDQLQRERDAAQRDIEAYQRKIGSMKQQMNSMQQGWHGERGELEDRLRHMEGSLQEVTDEVARGNNAASRELAQKEHEINKVRQESAEGALRKELELRELMQAEIDKQREEVRLEAEAVARNERMAREIADLRAMLHELAAAPVEPVVIAPLPGPPPPPPEVRRREGPSEAELMAREIAELRGMLSALKAGEPNCPPGMQMVPVSSLPPGALAAPGSIRRAPPQLQHAAAAGLPPCAPFPH